MWPIITAFFEEKKLVRQQLDSFDRFTNSTIARIVEDESRMDLIVDRQYTSSEEDVEVRFWFLSFLLLVC